jgi:hypothetical protein
MLLAYLISFLIIAIWAHSLLTETSTVTANHPLSIRKYNIKVFWQVHARLMTFPSKARIAREPLGVVLVISAWNYPLRKLEDRLMMHMQKYRNNFKLHFAF